MYKKTPYKSPSELKLNLKSQSMLTGRKLILLPLYPYKLGGLAEGVVFSQLAFLTGILRNETKPITRISYTKLQRHLPFFSRRWLIEIIKRLEILQVISIDKDGGVNRIEVMNGAIIDFVINEENKNELKKLNSKKKSEAIENKDWDEYENLSQFDESSSVYTSKLVIFPELACKIGLLEAIALQQIHIRHYHEDGQAWVRRSIKKWHVGTFMFLGESTIKRLFSRLNDQGLIFVKNSKSEIGMSKAYRVNYIKVAEILGIPVPHVQAPEKNEWGNVKWVNPLTPLVPK